jgi:Na+-translocating ferredoxin:NAD+ oxidoreductase RnfA subunit
VQENATESTVCVPLLYSNNCKVVVQELLQYLLNVFLQEVKSPLKSCAGWALALIRRIITDSEDLEHDDIPATNHASSYKLTLTSFPHDSALHILSSLLLDFRNNPVSYTCSIFG